MISSSLVTCYVYLHRFFTLLRGSRYQITLGLQKNITHSIQFYKSKGETSQTDTVTLHHNRSLLLFCLLLTHNTLSKGGVSRLQRNYAHYYHHNYWQISPCVVVTIVASTFGFLISLWIVSKIGLIYYM